MKRRIKVNKDICAVCGKLRKIHSIGKKVGKVCRKCDDSQAYWQKVHEYDLEHDN